MPPKLPKKFEGEGNPSESFNIPGEAVLRVEPTPALRVTTISDEEHRVLKTLLDRDRTSRIVHGGLKSLLGLSDDDVSVLLTFLDRI